MKLHTLKRLIAFALIGTATLTAHAETHYSSTYNICMNNVKSDSKIMQNCAVAETKIQDARLNANYKQLMQHMTPKQQTALRNAQRIWIKYRDAEVKLIAAEEPAIADYLAADMYLYLTAQRADHLTIKYNNLPHKQRQKP